MYKKYFNIVCRTLSKKKKKINVQRSQTLLGIAYEGSENFERSPACNHHAYKTLVTRFELGPIASTVLVLDKRNNNNNRRGNDR